MELGEIHDHRNRPDDYIASIVGSLSVRKTEKDQFGEVFTPLKIINAMLDQLPEEIWSEPTKKWLDPAAGFGNFLMVVYSRLMNGLSDVIPDPNERSAHIIRNMLYMVEYNETSCQRIREIFGSTMNLCCSSFLDQNGPIFTDGGTTNQFDVIVGNPPFNADQTHEGKKGGGSILWDKFVKKSLDTPLLKPDAYLLFVHPALWRKPPSDRAMTLFDMMTHRNHMIYLEIHSKPDGKRDFNVQTRYDFYLIQKRRPAPGVDMTQVKDQIGSMHTIDLSRWQFLPNHSFELIEPLLTEKPQPHSVIFSRTQYGTDKPCVGETNQPGSIPLIHSTPRDGPRILWSSLSKESCPGCVPMIGVPKVIFGESGIHNVIIDLKGEYGITQCAIALKIPTPIETEGLLMKQALESEAFARILNAMSFSNFRIDWRMFLYFKPDFYKDVLRISIEPVQPSFVRVKGSRSDFEPNDGVVLPIKKKPAPTPGPSKQGGTKQYRRNFTKRRDRSRKKQKYTRKKY